VRTHNGIGTRLYGHADPQPVTPERRAELERAGFVPYSYRAVKWFVFLLVPVYPLGTFRVIKGEQAFLSTSTRYLMEPVPTDRKQIIRHLAVGWGLVAVFALGFLYLLGKQ
jgi:hypothetical protein